MQWRLAVGFGSLAVWAGGWSAALPAWLFLAAVSVPLAAVDLTEHRLPDRLTGLAAVGGIVLLGAAATVEHEPGRLARVPVAALAVAGALLVLVLVAPSGFGLGDVKLGGVLAGYLGWQGWAAVLPGLFAGFLIGAVGSLVLIVAGRAGWRSPLAFGPALITGALLVAGLEH